MTISYHGAGSLLTDNVNSSLISWLDLSMQLLSVYYLLHQHDRALVRFPPVHNVVPKCEYKHAREHDRRPIERRDVDVLHSWPAGPKEDKKTVKEANAVDPDASAA